MCKKWTDVPKPNRDDLWERFQVCTFIVCSKLIYYCYKLYVHVNMCVLLFFVLVFFRIQKRFIVDQGYKKTCLQAIGNSWKNFKSTLTREYIKPNMDNLESLVNPPPRYNWLDPFDWSMFVKSRLKKEFLVSILFSKFPLIESKHLLILYINIRT